MKVNIVDTKGDFKKSVDNNENPKTIEDTIKSIENIQKIVGKKIILILRDLRWSVKELNQYIPMGLLDKELQKIIDGDLLNIEVSDM